MTALPVLPYAGTSGHASSATSRRRTEHLDDSGKTESRQRRTLTMLAYRGLHGITNAELMDALGIPMHSAAPITSTLHKQELVVRLKEARGECEVYVLPGFVNGRELSPRGTHGARAKVLAEVREALERHEEICPNPGYACADHVLYEVEYGVSLPHRPTP